MAKGPALVDYVRGGLMVSVVAVLVILVFYVYPIALFVLPLGLRVVVVNNCKDSVSNIRINNYCSSVCIGTKQLGPGESYSHRMPLQDSPARMSWEYGGVSVTNYEIESGHLSSETGTMSIVFTGKGMVKVDLNKRRMIVPVEILGLPGLWMMGAFDNASYWNKIRKWEALLYRCK